MEAAAMLRAIYSRGAINIYRLGRWFHLKRMPAAGHMLTVINRLVYATVIPCSADIGKDFVVGYGGLGVVIHGSCKIGDRVHICQNVTIGRNPSKPGVPRIASDVYIGPGAVVSGPISIGEGAVIGANAVVLCDVPAGSVCVGVPGRIISAS